MALSTLEKDSSRTLTKAGIIELAQPFCTTSFTHASDGGLYTAWKSIETLLKKDLVYERGRPLRNYSLTDEGWEIADKIKAAEAGGTMDRFVQRDESRASSKQPDEGRVAKSSSRVSKGIPEAQYVPQDSGSAHPRADSSLSRSASLATLTTSQASGLNKSKQTTQQFVDLLSSPEPEARMSKVASKPPNGNINQNQMVDENDSGLNGLKSGASSKLTKSTGPTAESLPSFNPIVLPPGSFSVRLALDNREVRHKNDRDDIANQLTDSGVTPLVRPLQLGDIFWIAKIHDPSILPRHGEEGDEVALDWIVERKRLDDLVGSIKDGRFNEQKFRLRRSHVKNVIYLIEDIKLSPDDTEKFGEAIESSISSLQVLDNYFVKRTGGINESIRYLAQLTNMLKTLYESKPLNVIPANVLKPKTIGRLFEQIRMDPKSANGHYNITVTSFDSLASKSDTLTLRDVFLKMLMCTRGVSGDKALAMQRTWSTPRTFMEAFEHCEDDKVRDTMIARKLENAVGKAQVKGALSAKLAEYWATA